MAERQTELRLFSTLFDQYREPFISFAHSYVRDRTAAEDIYMEAMMQYWEKRSDLQPDTNIPAYILTCVKNKAINHLRHLQVISEAQQQIQDHRMREIDFRICSLEACDPSDLFASEVKQLIRETLSSLPPQTRSIFFKSRYENKTNKEIASELGISIKTVEFHISKALKEFRIQLKDYLPMLMLLLSRFS